jgi:hypothetical protein
MSETFINQWLCPGCGIRPNPGGLDEEGCCTSCGADCCGPEQLLEFLAEQGLHVVTAADKAVLDTMAAVDIEADEERRVAGFRRVVRAELARREAKR